MQLPTKRYGGRPSLGVVLNVDPPPCSVYHKRGAVSDANPQPDMEMCSRGTNSRYDTVHVLKQDFAGNSGYTLEEVSPLSHKH